MYRTKNELPEPPCGAQAGSGSSRSRTVYNWNYSTINCYERRMVCAGCDLDSYCSRRQTRMCINEYNMTPMKYAVLQTYAKYGAPAPEGAAEEVEENAEE